MAKKLNGRVGREVRARMYLRWWSHQNVVEHEGSFWYASGEYITNKGIRDYFVVTNTVAVRLIRWMLDHKMVELKGTKNWHNVTTHKFYVPTKKGVQWATDMQKVSD